MIFSYGLTIHINVVALIFLSQYCESLLASTRNIYTIRKVGDNPKTTCRSERILQLFSSHDKDKSSSPPFISVPRSRFIGLINDCGDDRDSSLNRSDAKRTSQRRRELFQNAIVASTSTTTLLWSNNAASGFSNTATITTSNAAITSQSSTTANTANNKNYISSDGAKVTHKVFFNVRISRPDGTFYVRDHDDTDNEMNKVYTGQLIFELFGQNAPNHVQSFLQYVVDPAATSSSIDDRENETPYPSYSRSSFTQYDDATGVLYGGTIPSLEVVEIQQSVALRYGNRLLPAKLWLEQGTTLTSPKISHNTIGLLTHQQLDATPNFGITTRNDTTLLNPTHTVFGKLVLNKDGLEFLNRVTALPTYSVDRPVITSSSPSSFVVDDTTTSGATTIMSTKPATEAIYMAQREFFRNTAKAFGDSRINKLYDGKILRRIEVTQVGLL
jgi:cyclophilin family peptidyl-prolyl cis-trans isomerase